MAKELYLYSPIYDFVAVDLIAAIEEHSGEDITLRVNSPGGSVFSNYGICAKMTEHGAVNVKVDGAAMSSGANLLPYAKFVECLDVSTFLLHRADMYVENDADKAFLAKINKDLKAKLLMKVDQDTFKEVTGHTIEEMFNSETRIDIFLDAKQAKKIGLVDKITKLSPADVTAFNNKMFAVAAISNPTQENKPTNHITMTLDKLKAEHPAVYAEVFALGIAQEKDRVEACMAFVEIDPAAVKTAIEGGKPLTQKQMADFTIKAMSKNTLTALAGEQAPPVAGSEESAAKTVKENAIAEFEKSVNANLNIKTV
jgi:ATP-dependent protease ClpP protease subunit